MEGEVTSYDCVIAGGGPAGALCAATLASWGRRVLLVHQAAGPHKPPSETLVPSALPLFESYGLGELIRQPQWEGTARHGTIWGSRELRWREVGEGGRGYRIEREAFDRDLRQFAVQRGATLLEDWRVVDPLREQAAWKLSGPDGQERRVRAGIRVVSAGRPGGGESAVEPRDRPPIETCALSTVLEGDGEFEDATLVEAVREGWLWWLPLRGGRVGLTLFADLDEVKQRGRDKVFAASLSESLGPARNSKLGRVRGTVCTPGLRGSQGDVLFAGDAAANIDPLSSQGFEKALASGWDTALAVNTWIEEPELEGELQAHRARWEARLFQAHARDTLAFYLQEARFAEAPFWLTRRAEAARKALELPLDEELPACLERHPDLVEARELIRRDRRLVPVPAFRLNHEDSVLHQLGGVELTSLIALLPASPEQIMERARRHPAFAHMTPSLLRQSLGELLRLGYLRAGDLPSRASRDSRSD